jgi:hypothetical protein
VFFHEGLAFLGRTGFQALEKQGMSADCLGADVMEEDLTLAMEATKPELEFRSQSAPGAQKAGIARGFENEFMEIEVELGDLCNGGCLGGLADVLAQC